MLFEIWCVPLTAELEDRKKNITNDTFLRMRSTTRLRAWWKTKDLQVPEQWKSVKTQRKVGVSSLTNYDPVANNSSRVQLNAMQVSSRHRWQRNETAPRKNRLRAGPLLLHGIRPADAVTRKLMIWHRDTGPGTRTLTATAATSRW